MLALDVERAMRLTPPTSGEAHVGALARSVGRAYRDACRAGAPELDAALKQAVVSLVSHLRANGMPPERVVVILKQALTDGDAKHQLPTLGEDDSADEDRQRQRAYQHALLWCLDAYYGELLPSS